MAPLQSMRKILVVLSLVFVLFVGSACSAVDQTNRVSAPNANSSLSYGQSYGQLERGDTAAGQDFSNWVIQTARGLVQDAYVRGDDKLGVVIAPQVRPDEVRPLARSLVQGFHRNAPNRDLTVLMYAPDKKLILTAKYNNSTNQIQYQ
ncbi:MAG: hypothetical protein IGS38_04380 [Synechococcales cyanobacterium M58_A2018_015]|nr:hypothetical protein [Synechococcales cyanobacterium M58_A2018_015]